IEMSMQVLRLVGDIQHPGDDLPFGGVLLEEVHRRQPVMHVIVGIELAQHQRGAVMLFHRLYRAGRIVDADRVASGHEVEPAWLLNATQGLITSMKAVPLCSIAALMIGTSWVLSPENERATKVAPSCS